YDPSYTVKPLHTIRLMRLGHLGGVRHYAYNEPVNTRRFAAVREGLDFFKDDPLAVEPGSRYLYSTYGYSLLGCAVESASGQAFADYLRDKVSRPAGRERTRPDDPRGRVPHRPPGCVQYSR